MKYNIPCFDFNLYYNKDDFYLYQKSVNYNLIYKNYRLASTGRLINRNLYGIQFYKSNNVHEK